MWAKLCQSQVELANICIATLIAMLVFEVVPFTLKFEVEVEDFPIWLNV